MMESMLVWGVTNVRELAALVTYFRPRSSEKQGILVGENDLSSGYSPVI